MRAKTTSGVSLAIPYSNAGLQFQCRSSLMIFGISLEHIALHPRRESYHMIWHIIRISCLLEQNTTKIVSPAPSTKVRFIDKGSDQQGFKMQLTQGAMRSPRKTEALYILLIFQQHIRYYVLCVKSADNSVFHSRCQQQNRTMRSLQIPRISRLKSSYVQGRMIFNYCTLSINVRISTFRHP